MIPVGGYYRPQNMNTQNSGINSVVMKSKNALKYTAKARAAANKHYNSLSHVLKDIKTKSLWNAGFAETFAVYDIMNPHVLTPELLLNLAAPEMFKADKRGKLKLALWGMSAQKDANGNPALDEKGKVIKVPVPRIVKVWTPNKVLLLLAQSAAFRNQKPENPKLVQFETH